MFVSLRWFCVNRTTVNAQFFSQLKVHPMPSWKVLAPFTRRDILLLWSSETLTELLCFLSTSIHVHNILLTFIICLSWISTCPFYFLDKKRVFKYYYCVSNGQVISADLCCLDANIFFPATTIIFSQSNQRSRRQRAKFVWFSFNIYFYYIIYMLSRWQIFPWKWENCWLSAHFDWD